MTRALRSDGGPEANFAMGSPLQKILSLLRTFFMVDTATCVYEVIAAAGVAGAPRVCEGEEG